MIHVELSNLDWILMRDVLRVVVQRPWVSAEIRSVPEQLTNLLGRIEQALSEPEKPTDENLRYSALSKNVLDLTQWYADMAARVGQLEKGKETT